MSKKQDFTDSTAIRELLVSKGWELISGELNTRITNLSDLLDNPENLVNPLYQTWLVQKSECMKLLILPSTMIIEKAQMPKQEGLDPY